VLYDHIQALSHLSHGRIQAYKGVKYDSLFSKRRARNTDAIIPDANLNGIVTTEAEAFISLRETITRKRQKENKKKM
jgi:hypothetical protein